MTPLFAKLNLKDQTEIVVVAAPEEFEERLAELTGVTIHRKPASVKRIEFLLVFVKTLDELNRAVAGSLGRTVDDAVIWFAYPKGTSKKYRCEFNRDNGWSSLGDAGYEGVRMVAIDADWSALRFRKPQFIKKMSRGENLAISAEGRRRAAGSRSAKSSESKPSITSAKRTIVARAKKRPKGRSTK